METLAHSGDGLQGQRAAHLIWADDPAVDKIVDPHTRDFANAVLDTLSQALIAAPGAMKRAIRTAARSAERLNVEPYQGLVEVIQNADDLKANEVRFAFRQTQGHSQLLVVHDGEPVTCRHVLGMVIPYFTTKEHEADQRGRFGIGLKTLARIASSMSIHSDPYHFRGNQEKLERTEEESPIPDFYDPAVDTMIVLNLKPDFHAVSLREWYERWDSDGLIFLSSVCSFRWCDLGSGTISGKLVEPGPWAAFGIHKANDGIKAIEKRIVASAGKIWTIWKARVSVPPDKHPEHKARNDTVHISIAVSNSVESGHLHIGFRTRVPVSFGVSLDAPFDPSTAREGLVQDDWNDWLISQCGTIVAEVAKQSLAESAPEAWRLVPLAGEAVGSVKDSWLRAQFDKAFQKVRASLAEGATVSIDGLAVPLSKLAYEAPELGGLLSSSDIEMLAAGRRALPDTIRDPSGRWRSVLDEFSVCKVIGTSVLLSGFSERKFESKSPEWWVRAASCLTKYHATDALFGIPFWLSEELKAVPCQRANMSFRRLVFGAEISRFAERLQLFDRLHDAYGQNEQGEKVIEWLVKNTAFTAAPGAIEELEAFAARYAKEPVEIEPTDLREIRDHFDQLSERIAERIGRSVGAALLLDAVTYKGGKLQRIKVSPTQAYLSKSLDSDNPNWPIAAGTLPGISWIAARYEKQLKTGAGRGARRRGEDGMISRGSRRFLMLLGAEVAPRLVESDAHRERGPTRSKELRANGANDIPQDYASPDLERVLGSFTKMSVKDRKVRSPALLRSLARNWSRVYAERAKVASRYFARTLYHPRGQISASWICRLKDTPWMVVGRGDLTLPSAAVLKSQETQTLYSPNTFLVGVEPNDVHPDLAGFLGIRTDVRVSDVVTHLKEIRDGLVEADETKVLQIYRNLAKLCPKTPTWNTRIGDVAMQELRSRFGTGKGLIYAPSNEWRRPDEMLRGRDVFHDRARFAPGGQSCENLWVTLAVPTPSLDACLTFCRSLAGDHPNKTTTERLIDIYRYMEGMLGNAEKSHRERLRRLPLVCSGNWENSRPIFFVEDEELRSQLVSAQPRLHFWTPPCDTRDLPRLVSMLGLVVAFPALSIIGDREAARNQGDALRARFQQAVNHLADELARYDPLSREKLRIGWEALRSIPLFVYESPPLVAVKENAIAPQTMKVRLRALLLENPIEFHVCLDAIAEREHGGRAIASLFPLELHRKIDVEWLAAWLAAQQSPAEGLNLASDEALMDTLNTEADRMSATPRVEIRINPSIRRAENGVKPRTLKDTMGVVATVTAQAGTLATKATTDKATLSDTPLPPSPPADSALAPASMAFSIADLEQAGWEVLKQVLNTAEGEDLVDFRKRHGVGADGAFAWEKFVEMKATGRGPVSSIEMSATEYERAKKEGINYILALVSGLETGEKGQIRLIFDPANRASCKPTSGMRFYALNEAPSIVLTLNESPTEEE